MRNGVALKDWLRVALKDWLRVALKDWLRVALKDWLRVANPRRDLFDNRPSPNHASLLIL